LVANSVEGLKAEDVSIVDNRGQNLTEGLKDDPVLGAATSQMRLRKNVEDYFSSKVETMLARVLGPGKAVVRVSAELESEALTRSEEKFDPEGQVVRNETTTDDTLVTNESEPGAAPVGATANLNADAGAKNNSKTSDQQKKNKTTTFEINKVVLNSVKAPGSVSRLTAAVVVAPDPANAQEKDPKKAEKKTEDRKAMLRGMVANALGVKGTEEELKRVVSIEEMPFSEIPAAEQGVIDMIARNTDLLRDAGAVLVAVLLFGAFVRMLRKTKPDEIPMEMLSAQTEPDEPVGSLPGGQQGSSFAAPQPVTVDLINDMIRRKPENIGAALRNWIETDKANGEG
jgi:flagellar M-ring protein FliF